jgi:vanillate monooxygenase ferredoxin subunit
LLAGDIGITPILCMAERLATNGSPFTLHYCTRSRDRTAFRERKTQKLDMRGLLGEPRHDTHLYVCGPTRLVLDL